MKKQFFVFVTLLFAMGLPNLLMAQGIPEDPSDTMVPLDGGLSILLGAAAAYGSHKIQEHRKRKG
jgi:hypothetical protein